MTQAHPDIIPFPGRPQAAPTEALPSVLIVSSDLARAQSWANELQSAGFATRNAASVESAIQWLQSTAIDACLVGTLAPGDTLGALQASIQRFSSLTQLVEQAETGSSEEGFAGEFILPLHSQQRLPLVVAGACQRAKMQAEIRRLKRQLCNRNLRDMVGHSPAMQQLRERIQQLAELTEGVLITGEAGSGSDLVAQALHDASKRAHRPFVAIDCSVHSAETLELELFGIAESSTTMGATRQPGRLEQADGGTILFENVECIALPLQRRLATVLADQRFEHGTTGERVRFDIRVMFATHVDLEELQQRGLFRSEFLAHAGECRVSVPALRTRPEDVAPLAEAFLRKVAAREGRPPRSLTLDALHRLQSHVWPGNVTELEHVIERACSLDAGRKLTATMLDPWLGQTGDDETPAGLTLESMERRLIETTFARFAGNREKTAKALQIGIRTLSGKLREYGYPPRGGPGSNIRPWSPDAADYNDDVQTKAA